MWLVQRYCEVNRSFSPPADNYKHTPFVQSFEVHHVNTHKQEYIFNIWGGQFISALVKDNPNIGVAIFKGDRAGSKDVTASLMREVGAVSSLDSSSCFIE